MPKWIESPVKKFPGYVMLPDFLTFPQAIEWEKALSAAGKLKTNPDVTEAEYFSVWPPVFVAVVEDWNLKGIDPQKFPRTPRVPVAELISWLVGEITNLYDEETDPNE